jgi:signal peptidase I
MSEAVSRPKKSWVREWVETIIVALVLALIIRTFIIQVFYIPSGSMVPTLKIRDRIIVNKFIYKLRDPKRFEIVVFKYPYPRPDEPRRDYIKRIVGLPGDSIQVKNGVVFINGVKLREDHPINRGSSDYGPFQVPDDGYFMMGDNRPNSADSRVWGYLPRDHVIGPAILRIWPLNKFGFLSD